MLKAKLNTEIYSVRLGILFAKLGISANTWTLFSIIPAVLGFIATAYFHNLATGLILFIVAGFIDVVDGAVARVTRTVSALGAFLDGIIDRYVEVMIYIGLMIYLRGCFEFILPTEAWIALLIFGSIMPSYVRAYADHRKVVTDSAAHKRMGGLLERAERLTMIYVGMFLGLWSINLLVYFIAATAVLSNYTALQRIYFTVNYKKES